MMEYRSQSDNNRRRSIISEIEKARNSVLITYFLGDRANIQAQIAEDAVRPIYDHLRSIENPEKIDLFVYSIGGLTDVPWRIVTMIREFTDDFAVLIPYKAMSAATMIALGADEIVMGRKGELGPIDPQLSIQRGGNDGTAVQQQIAVEDIMAYVRFVRERAGLTDQAALAGVVTGLADKMDPALLGQINRVHSHIRAVARKLLTARSKPVQLDEQRMQVIVETLTERTYQHGHAIGRSEADDIGLNIVRPDPDLEDLMWCLFEEYEAISRLREPLDPRTFLAPGESERMERLTLGCIESKNLAHHCIAEFRMKSRRQPIPQLALNLSLNLQLPAGFDPAQLHEDSQQILQQLLNQVQQVVPEVVQNEVNLQIPVMGIEGATENTSWRQIQDWTSP